MSTVVFDEYGTKLERLRRNPRTINNFRVTAQRFVEWCEARGINPSEPAPEAVEEYFYGLKLAESTQALYLTQLRAAFSYALRRGVIHRDPTVDVQLPRIPDKTPNVIPIEHLRTAQENCANDDQLRLFRMAAYTGARAFEIQKMRWEDVDLANRTIEVIGKGGYRRLLPIHPALGELLHDDHGFIFGGRGGRQAHHGTMNDRLHKIIPTYTFHDFRRTVASSLDANGVEEGLINRIMGWAPKTIFDRHYRNVAGERLQQAILRLYASEPL